MRKYTSWTRWLGVGLSSLCAATAQAAARVPAYDHVVVVIMENHGAAQIIGNPAAPYLSSLATQGANLTDSHGVTHPSQPNYLALFSGSTHGVADDRCPLKLSGTNLAVQLLAKGKTFVGYAEDLPQTGSTECRSGAYARKHAPWVNFSNVPPGVNRPFAQFPTDFQQLPTVAFVVPNLMNDMHDGPVAQGDAWLHDHLDAYAQWAKTHNSLLIVTFDEDDYSTKANRIPTMFVGDGVRTGPYAGTVNHYNVLATIQAMYGLPRWNKASVISAIFR